MNKTSGLSPANNDILLESGTNEVEILVFKVGVFRLGINVAKVREILTSQKITKLPKAHPSVVGCFQLRDVVVPCVSLHQRLNQVAKNPTECKLILAEFNQTQTAFIVDEVDRIHRISWSDILPVPSVVADAASPITAVCNLEGRLVTLLDFETITSEMSNEEQRTQQIDNTLAVPRADCRLLVVDDSPTVRVILETTLNDNGYTNVTCFEHGAQAWDWISQRLRETGDVSQVADLVITDVEMPSMDGLHLTQTIKRHPQLHGLPVILYSSILTPDNLKKGRSVGADAQLTKRDPSKVVALADELLSKRIRGAAAAAPHPAASELQACLS
ncbi:chemotaxis protein [Lignipirellula cremea]|uniref:Chemotaxis protein CheV n=1 Tax=Lignipirellula cremea TaxID=2528010 RepID=A0A518DUB9_9BACT|nr:chemotaxis protein [Lignipirellula cremea]QDU95429.1 Chemotaxis protein CheV [Lignipirellula cremea]